MPVGAHGHGASRCTIRLSSDEPQRAKDADGRTERPAVERAGMDADFFATADEFEGWLEANAAAADEVLVCMAKKHTGVASLDWAGAVEVALCFGWIDGRSKRIDDEWFVQRFTPRRPQSTWSKVNRQKVEALIAAGRMRPA